MKNALFTLAALSLAFSACTSDIDSDNSQEQNSGPESSGKVAKVVLNELDGNNKFIEMYNAGEAEADLSGWQILKDGEGAKWTGPAGTTLAAGAYKVLECVKESVAYDTDFGAGFSAKKNVQLILVDADGNEIDRFERGTSDNGWGNDSLPENTECSFSRVPDGTGDFVYAASTKGSANGTKVGDIEQE